MNLRFYVRRTERHEERRGVVFIAEIVPKRAVAQLARVAYGENYIRLPMGHSIVNDAGMKAVEYRWRLNGGWCKLNAQSAAIPTTAPDASLEQFITEHYWGYSKQPNRGTVEYEVAHVPWNVWTSSSAGFEGNAADIYGPQFAEILKRPPDSAFIADGSPVTVFTGQKIV